MTLSEFIKEFRDANGHSRRSLTWEELRTTGVDWIEQAAARLDGTDRSDFLECVLCSACSGHGMDSIDIGGVSRLLVAIERDNLRLSPVLALVRTDGGEPVQVNPPTGIFNPFTGKAARQQAREQIETELLKKKSEEGMLADESEEQSHDG